MVDGGEKSFKPWSCSFPAVEFNVEAFILLEEVATEVSKDLCVRGRARAGGNIPCRILPPSSPRPHPSEKTSFFTWLTHPLG